jgi:hypothetical protein
MMKIWALLLIVGLGFTPLFPQGRIDAVPPGNWAKVESLIPGTEISVQLTSGDRIQGEFLGLEADAIRLNVGYRESAYPRPSVVEIQMPGVKDSNKNGTLIGMGIGAGCAAILAAASYDKNDPYKNLGWVGIPLFAGVGALVGYGIDHTRSGASLIYRAEPTR